MDNLFETQELLLRPFEALDLPALAEYLNHPELAGRRYLPWRVPELAPLSLVQVEGIFKEWQEVENGWHMAIIRKGDQALVGHAEVDWGWDRHCPSFATVIAPAYQRRGYAEQVLKLQLRYLFEFTPAHSVSAWISSWNEAGLAFVRASGFQQDGCLRRTHLHNGKYSDSVVMSLLRSEWLAAQGGAYGA